MLTLVKMEAVSFCKCSCCGESIRKCEQVFQVKKNGKAVRGERYCLGCESVAYENNDFDSVESESTYDDGERHLRQMEDFAAYQHAGCTNEYWSDRDAGYCN